MTKQSLTREARPASSLPMPVRIVLRLVAVVGWTVLGLFLFRRLRGDLRWLPPVPLTTADHHRHDRHRPDRRHRLDRRRAALP